MPPKRRAVESPDAEPPAKRITSSSSTKLTPLTRPRKTRIESPAPSLDSKELSDDPMEESDAELPPKHNTRSNSTKFSQSGQGLSVRANKEAPRDDIRIAKSKGKRGRSSRPGLNTLNRSADQAGSHINRSPSLRVEEPLISVGIAPSSKNRRKPSKSLTGNKDTGSPLLGSDSEEEAQYAKTPTRRGRRKTAPKQPSPLPEAEETDDERPIPSSPVLSTRAAKAKQPFAIPLSDGEQNTSTRNRGVLSSTTPSKKVINQYGRKKPGRLSNEKPVSLVVLDEVDGLKKPTRGNEDPASPSPLHAPAPTKTPEPQPPAPRKLRSAGRGVPLDAVEITSSRKSTLRSGLSFKSKETTEAVPITNGQGKDRVEYPAAPLSPSPIRARPTTGMSPPPASHVHLPVPLPTDLHPYLKAQQRAILSTIHNASITADCAEHVEISAPGLLPLLRGTVERGEGNSCLVLGPSGSGKSRAVELALTALPSGPIVVRLSGLTHPDDRSALGELRRQIFKALGEADGDAPDENADDDDDDEEPDTPFAALPALSRPLIVILHDFDVFCMRPRQALLYVLLDAVQSLRIGAVGIAVVGVTCRIDCVTLLEKRVKSRFSHRIIRVSPPKTLEEYVGLARGFLSVPLSAEVGLRWEEWAAMWKQNIESFLTDTDVQTMLRQTWELLQDVRLLQRILIHAIVHLNANSPRLYTAILTSAIAAQRGSAIFPHLKSLPFPALALLIAGYHSGSAGHDTFTFEQLEHSYRAYARENVAAMTTTTQLQMPRAALLSAFDDLVDAKIFTAAALPFAPAMREFTRYRCSVERKEIEAAIAKGASTEIQRWLTKWVRG